MFLRNSNINISLEYVNLLQKQLDEINKEIYKLNNETEILKEEQSELSKVLRNIKMQNPEHFLYKTCVCRSSEIDVATYYKVPCPICKSTGKEIDTEFVRENHFFKGKNNIYYGYVIDNSKEKFHIYNILDKKTLCETDTHNFKINNFPGDICSLCNHLFEKLGGISGDYRD
ncbi:MAG: hypothetical protein H7836_08060 [Magnetococcus sp. YQC-3]